LEVVSIIGGGYVGLNNAVLFAKKGYEVKIIDINPNVVKVINSGDLNQLHVLEEFIAKHWKQVRDLIEATYNYSIIRESKYVLIAVNTPLKVFGDDLLHLISNGVLKYEEYLDFDPLKNAVNEIAKYIQPGTLVSSEVTIYPGGTFERIAKPLEELSSLKLEKELFVVHAPERINPGDNEWIIEKIPRVIGGIGDRSLSMGIRLYRDKLGLQVYPTRSLMEAELTKLIENAQRYINISFMSMIEKFAEGANINFKNVVKLASTKPFGFTNYYPGYAGGACLPKDTLMLYLWMVNTGSTKNAEMLRNAIEVNELYPKYMAEKIMNKVKSENIKRILFYGIGFKPGSPYYVSEKVNPIARIITELKEISMRENINLDIKVYDPKIPTKSDFKNEKEALEWADYVFKWGY